VAARPHSVFSLANSFWVTLIVSVAVPLYKEQRGAGRSNRREDQKMEKWLVVAGVWSMCALCAVLFIRGATAPESRKLRVVRANQGDATGGTQR
jgi:hypothetical protein